MVNFVLIILHKSEVIFRKGNLLRTWLEIIECFIFEEFSKSNVEILKSCFDFFSWSVSQSWIIDPIYPMKALGLHVLLVPQGNKITRWSLMLTQSLIFYPLNQKLCYFLVMEPPLVLKRSQYSFSFFGFQDSAFHKVWSFVSNSRVSVLKSRKGFILK